MRTLILAASLLAAASSPAWAQTKLTPEALKDRQALGVSLSNIGGSGLTYVRMAPNGFGWRVAGVGWGQQGSAFWNVGAAVLREFDRKDWGSIYGMMSAGTGINLFSGGFGMGANQGVEANVAPGLGVNYGPLYVEAGYSVWYNQRGIGFGPGFGAGLLYWF